MKAPETLTTATAEARFITEGPSSGGIAGWLLHEGHMFFFRQEFSSGEIHDGIPLAAWLERYAGQHPGIAARLRADLSGL